MKSILHIIDSLSVGGAEKLLAGIIDGMKGYNHHLMILRGPDTLREQIKAPYHFVNLQCNSFTQLISKSRIVRRYIRDHHIDIVHSHLYESNLVARLGTPRSVTLINSIHAISSEASYRVNRMSLYLEKLSYKKRHVLIAVSKAVLDDFNQWIGIKGDCHVLYNFIEDRFFVPTIPVKERSNTLRLVAVGNLRWQKNYPYLIESFKKMPSRVQLDIYGQGDERESMQQQIDAHRLNIRLLGVRNDLEKVLPGYDAFVMSSFYEGQPLSLLEASACGLPAILSDIPVLHEVMEDDAIYFDIKKPESLVEKVKEVLDDKYDLIRLSVNGAKKVKSFALKQHYLEKLSGIYKQYL